MKKITIATLSLIATVGWSTALISSTQTDNPDLSVGQPIVHKIKNTASAWTPRASSFAERVRLSPIAFNITGFTPKVLGAQTYNTDILNVDQALNLDKPGVVSVINRLGGSLTVPDFDIDLKSFAIVARPDLPIHETKIAGDLYGTGFVVNSNGYIITNAHVISKSESTDKLTKDVQSHFKDIYQYELDSLSDKDYKAYNAYLDKIYGVASADSDKKIQAAAEAAVSDYIKSYSKDLTTQNIIVVDKSLNPETLPKNKELDTVFAKGLPVTIIGFDPYYKASGADIALLQVSGQNLPALPLGDATGVTSGSSVVVLGYPYNAQIDNSDFFQPTLTQGIVSSVKEYNSQKVLQLDNKTAQGSSGSPVIDQHGRVIGIITYINGDPSTGDQFTYALTIDLAKTLMNQHQVANDLGVYGNNFIAGIALQNKNSCKKALDAFNSATGADSHFAPQNYVSSYIQSCQSSIAAGTSNDSIIDSARIFYKEHAASAAIFTVLGLVLLFFIAWLVFYLVKHFHKTQTLIQPPIPQVNLN